MRQVPDDIHSGWDHNEAGPRDPRDASADYDPNELTLCRDDMMTPAPSSEVVQLEPIEGPSTGSAPIDVPIPVETYPSQLPPDPYARHPVKPASRSGQLPS